LSLSLVLDDQQPDDQQLSEWSDLGLEKEDLMNQTTAVSAVAPMRNTNVSGVDYVPTSTDSAYEYLLFAQVRC
jgi:hypothetical protein